MWLPWLVVALALAARWLPGLRIIDDAYITFRYARNIVAGFGPVYNPGEHVLGTTTPLYTALLALLGAIGGGPAAPFPALAVTINALCDALTVWWLMRLGHRLGTPWAGLGAALTWAIHPYSVTFAIGGMETSLFVCLLTGTVWAYLTRREVMAALLAAAALLTRPDAVLLLAPLTADWLLRTRHPDRHPPHRWRVLLVFSLPILSWAAFAWLYYGTPLPHSIAAKEAAYRMPPKAALVRLLQHYATPFLGHETLGIPWIGVGLVLYPFLFVLGARFAWQRSRRWLAWLVYPWLYFLVFAWANPLIFRWYLTPPLLPYLFFIWVGLERLGQHLTRFRAYAAILGLVFPVMLVLRGWEVHPDHGPDRPAPRMAWFQLELLYQQAAGELEPLLRPGDHVAAADIGTLGYYTQAPILDVLGLISPEVTPYYPVPPESLAPGMVYAVPTQLILDQRPEYLVVLEAYVRNTLLADPRFRASYRLIRRLPTTIYGSHGMLIFQRR